MSFLSQKSEHMRHPILYQCFLNRAGPLVTMTIYEIPTDSEITTHANIWDLGGCLGELQTQTFDVRANAW